MICPNCKRNIPDDSKLCCYCGQHIEESSGMMLCSHPQCGKEIPSDSKFCPFCGTKVSSTSAENSVQDKLTFEVNGVSFNMIRVEGGTFTMGATPEQNNPNDDEKPTQQVTLSSYYIGETQVTRALWKAIMGHNFCSNIAGENLPKIYLGWWFVRDFIDRLNEMTHRLFRLPAEAEWEFAARGGNKSNYYQYSGSNSIDEVAWYGENSDGKPHAVKTKKPNELGIYDMNGNVWEWCNDWLSSHCNASQTDYQSPDGATSRVVRGGSWADEACYCHSSYRCGMDCTGFADDRQGLRLVLSE